MTNCRRSNPPTERYGRPPVSPQLEVAPSYLVFGAATTSCIAEAAHANVLEMNDGWGQQQWGHLRAWDMVLTIDVMVVMFALTMVINVAFLPQSPLIIAAGPTVLAGVAFAKWRAAGYTEAPPPPTDNMLLRS